MKPNTTKIVVILDRSGSMKVIQKATIDSFNEFVNAQKSLPGETSIRLVQFDDIAPYDVVFDSPAQSAPVLDEKTFVPRGMTPLHDAMGRSINQLGNDLAALPESERPTKVIVVTITDGYENASTDYDRKKVANMIQHQKEKYFWDFLFLAANQDAVLTASRFNIDAGKSLTYNANAQSVAAMGGALRSYAFAAGGTSDPDALRYVNFTEEDKKNAQQ